MNAFRVLQNTNSAVCNIDGKAKWAKVNWFIGRYNSNVLLLVFYGQKYIFI